MLDLITGCLLGESCLIDRPCQEDQNSGRRGGGLSGRREYWTDALPTASTETACPPHNQPGRKFPYSSRSSKFALIVELIDIAPKNYMGSVGAYFHREKNLKITGHAFFAHKFEEVCLIIDLMSHFRF